MIHRAISDGSTVPPEIELPLAETEEFYNGAEVVAAILKTGENYEIDCVASDEGKMSFRIIAEVSFKVNGSYEAEKFEILSYERSFIDD